MTKPFQPPSTVNEVVDQQRNLYNNLKEFQNLAQLPLDATLEDVVVKINHLMTALTGITRSGTVIRRG